MLVDVLPVPNLSALDSPWENSYCKDHLLLGPEVRGHAQHTAPSEALRDSMTPSPGSRREGEGGTCSPPNHASCLVRQQSTFNLYKLLIILFCIVISSGYKAISYRVLCHPRSLEKALLNPIMQINKLRFRGVKYLPQ